MPDKRIDEMPDESTMTTADADKILFIGDPSTGKLYKGTITQLIALVGGGGTGSRFGFSGEDDAAAEVRSFAIVTNSFIISGTSGTFGFTFTDVDGNVHTVTLQSYQNVVVVTDGTNTAGSNLNPAYAELNASGGGASSYIRAVKDYIRFNQNTGHFQFDNISDHADNAAAITAGLSVGMIYKTGDNLKIVH